MAWLSGITGKAESFLNSLDQKAASVLHEQELEKTLSTNPTRLATKEPQQRERTPYISKDTKTNLVPSHSVPSALSEFKSSDIPTATKPKPEGSSRKKADADEALFEFLNSPEPTERSERRKPSTPVSSQRHSRQSSASSVVSNKVGGTTEGQGSSSTSASSMIHVEMPGTDSRGSPAEMDVAALEDAMQDQSPSNSVHSNQELEATDHPMASSADLENRLLKNEITSLNQELSSMVQRSKESQAEMTRLREEVNRLSQVNSRSDQMVRELHSREQDLIESLTAKDSQLAVLRVRLEEADRDIEAKQRSVSELEQVRERILRDHSDSSGIHSQALDSLRQKLSEMEGALQREQEASRISQKEVAERQARLEGEQKSFTEALALAEKKYSDEKAKVTEVSNQLKSVKNSLDSAKQELIDYKEKATRILQSKERLIASLRDGSGVSGESGGVSHLEYDSVKQERDMLKEEIQQARMTIDNLRVELADVEGSMQQEHDAAQDSIQSLEESVCEEKRRREEAEQDLLKHKKELQYAIEELSKQKTSFQGRLSDRDAEIERLRNQLTTKSMSSSTEYELESRVRELTESLIQKQTMVEALSTEKNSLGLQLERLGQQYKDIQASAMRTNTTVIPVHEEEDVRHRLPMFMRETASDTEVAKKMKRAANTIDRFSIRLGVFLRRYPIARVFVILYMALLHLWVMVVLLTYQPEMHGSEPHSVMPQEPPHP